MRLIAVACLFAVISVIEGDSDQRENVYTLVFDGSTKLFVDKLPGWDSAVHPDSGIRFNRD